MTDQQVGVLRHGSQVVKCLADARHEQLAKDDLGAVFRIHDALNRRAVGRVDIRPDRMKSNPCIGCALAVELARGHHGLVAHGLQSNGKG